MSVSIRGSVQGGGRLTEILDEDFAVLVKTNIIDRYGRVVGHQATIATLCDAEAMDRKA